MHLFMIRFVFHSGVLLFHTNSLDQLVQDTYRLPSFYSGLVSIPLSLSFALNLGTYNCTCKTRAQKSPTDSSANGFWVLCNSFERKSPKDESFQLFKAKRTREIYSESLATTWYLNYAAKDVECCCALWVLVCLCAIIKYYKIAMRNTQQHIG